MRERDAFSGCHPWVSFAYFACVLGVTMCVMHPAVLVISLGCALRYHLQLCGRAAVRLQTRVFLPMAVLAAVLNPAFNHAGVTILTYLPSGNPLTLESLAYGASAAVMLWAAVTWFACLSEIMTSDKLVCLLGRAAPALSLVLSMTLRFVPRFSAQMRLCAQAQDGLRPPDGSGVRRRVRRAVTVLSIMVTWSLENAVETANSMKSRGYGLPGRTSFALYRLTGRDAGLLAWECACAALVVFGWAAGGLDYGYTPVLYAAGLSPLSACFFAAWLCLCLTPPALETVRRARWRMQTNMQGEKTNG